MRSHVRRDAARLGKLPVADSTVERFLSRVGAAMCRLIGRLREGFVAAIVAVGPLPAVHPHVRLQGARPCITKESKQDISLAVKQDGIKK